MNNSNSKDESPVSLKPVNISEEQYKKETYERFVQALEKYGTSRKNAWDNISLDMGWPVKDVKAYAFGYMLKLHAVTSFENKDSERKLPSTGSSYDETCFSSLDILKNEKEQPHIWSYEECIFFDNLMARYFNKNNDICEIIEKIAELIPSKSMLQVRKRVLSHGT